MAENPILGVKNRAECTRRQGGYDPDQQVRLQINLIQGLIKYRKPPQNTPPSPENGENRTPRGKSVRENGGAQSRRFETAGKIAGFFKTGGFESDLEREFGAKRRIPSTYWGF